MRVAGYATDPEEQWTAPYPTGSFGLKLRLLKGNQMRPDMEGASSRAGREGEACNWFNCIPKSIDRRMVGYRPFLSIGIGWWGFYIGWKVYGVDLEMYLDYPGITSGDVYEGSRAMVYSMRFTTSREGA